MKKFKVLVVDDEDNIVKVLKYNLERQNYDVVVAQDGLDAVDKAVSEKPDVMLLDIMLPKKNGFEVCQTLREKPETNMLPIIMLSAKGEMDDKLTGFEIGADDYVSKPFDEKELLARVKALLVRSKGARAILSQSEKARKELSQTLHSGDAKFDSLIDKGIPRGANILLIGPVGTGKSTLCRKFIAEGLKQQESAIYISTDDPIAAIKEKLNSQLDNSTETYEKLDLLRFIYAFNPDVKGLGINLLSPSGIEPLSRKFVYLSDEIGQNAKDKSGGRRVMDSVSSMILNFGLQSAYSFLSQTVHSSTAFGQVTTFYTVEKDTVSDREINSIKLLMDGVVELQMAPMGVYARVMNLKWQGSIGNRVMLWMRK